MVNNEQNKIEKVVSLAKRRGFIFGGSEIYGGLGGTWDYGPLGVLLKNNVKNEWWESMVMMRNDIFGVDAAILTSVKVLEASGHVSNFTDPLVECTNCHRRFREDHLEVLDKKLLEKISKKLGREVDHIKRCPHCGGDIDLKINPSRKFNLLFKTYAGPVEDSASLAYLRPETAQGIFTNFKNILDTMRPKLPFGIAQIGKAFRNEITPGNFIFRTREFEQMELEFFVRPGEEKKHFEKWRETRFSWYTDLGINKKNLRFYDYPKEELVHYSSGTSDVEYRFNLKKEFDELEGIAIRNDYDLSHHAKSSGIDLTYFDDKENKRFFPYVIEPSAGVDRACLAFLLDAYCEEEDKEGVRMVLKLNPKLAPYKVAVFPLLANKEQLIEKAISIYKELNLDFMVAWDDAGNIGKRYRRQDEVGTPFCVTVDFETMENDTVTVRDRDTMKQERIEIKKLKSFLEGKIK
ncbi:MAG: glycine--tRNA ligase [Candidatus Portnoybacteria bacterium CG10_big_fil_rev_8_21_14_0_10_36_7]|uniref:Glycine--tRNA ligase n=1 Tax=Candidatus Portnoybacteria bacterium CG10_big_fil_rev_8_21_14_0_10_36_7 TaxID=1974812 RepID=A0A2M8KD97_9BACT|nr:MAG: glycine--tRNA ligase [Candidatus Portnoybacteria bacterium CG10_big_fil_rev_8_21_14_0_10_36_7]